MPYGPRPAGWEGGSDDFEFVLNGSAGRIGVNDLSDGDCAADQEYRRNAYSTSDFKDHFGQ